MIACSRYTRVAEAHPELDAERDIHLSGPPRDVAMLKPVFRDRLGIPEANLRILMNDSGEPRWHATRSNILTELDEARSRLARGSFLLLYFAGHGSQVPDLDGDESDGQDEVILPIDVPALAPQSGRSAGIENSISDDELRMHLAALQENGVFVWSIFDCCHAGTATRGIEPGLRKRSLAPSLLGVPPRSEPMPESRVLEPTAKAGVALYAAASHQETYELELPPGPEQEFHGILSYALARALSEAEPESTYRELHARILAYYEALPHRAASRPWLEGELDATLEGLSSPLDRGFVATRAAGDAEMRSWSIQVGSLLGVDSGSKFALLSREAGRDIEVATLVTTEVHLHASRGVIESSVRPAEDLPHVLRARLLEGPVRSNAIRLALLDPEGSPLPLGVFPEVVRTALERHEPRYTVAPDRHEADWLLELQEGSLILRPRMASLQCERFRVAPEHLERNLWSVFRVHTLRNLPISHPELGVLPRGLHIDATHVALSDGSKRSLSESAVLSVGDSIELVIRNETESTFDIGALAIDGNLGITLLPLAKQTTLRLGPHDRRPVAEPLDIEPGNLGIESLVVIAVPRRPGDSPVSLRWMEQAFLLKATRSALPLESYFANAESGGTRGPGGRKLNESMRIWTIQTVARD
ncbi:MAG: caspase family protein [Planctomycetes bacterium]|nr:caspase family protein [Planctomycetota bacterium]